MKRNLFLTLIIIGIAPLCGMDSYCASIYAPVIGNIPNIRIGDMEDNQGSAIDFNFFRFSNAFNFDDYVSGHSGDTDFAITNVRWSFSDDIDRDGIPEEYIDINGKTSLTSSADALYPGAKELTNFPNNDPVPRETSRVNFWDIQACPQKEFGIYPTPGTLTDTIITLYASNGSKVSSKSIAIQSVDGAFDNVSSPYAPPDPWRDLDSWTKTTPDDGTFINTPDSAFYIATRARAGYSLTITGDETRKVFASWESPADEIAYVANNVYRARFRLRTDRTDQNKVPKVRLTFSSSINIAFGGQHINSGANAPTTSAKDYWAYYFPPLLTGASNVNLKLNFDLIDFTTQQSGTVYLDEVQIQRFEAPSTGSGTPVVTFDAAQLASSWQLSNNVTRYGPLTAGSNSMGLYLESPVATQTGGELWGILDYASWNYPAGSSPYSWVANKLHRATFILQVPDAATQQTIAKLRMFIINRATDWIAHSQISRAGGTFCSHMPSPMGTEYSIFCHSPDILYGNENDKIGFIFDMADGSGEEYGRCYLTKVEVEYYDIP